MIDRHRNVGAATSGALALVALAALCIACGGASNGGTAGPQPSGGNTSPGPQATGPPPPFPLSVPSGFHVTMVSENVPGARFMAVAPDGDLLVSETGSGQVVAIAAGSAYNAQPKVVASNVNRPHGLAFHNSDLYVATWDGLDVIRNYPTGSLQTLYSGLLENSDHNNRSLAVSADGTTVYESYGSNNNIATPPPQSPAENSILAMSSNGSGVQAYATGVRNGSGLAFDGNGHLWMVVNQRDNVSPNTATNDANPVDELDQVQAGADYGYPYCYPPNGNTNIARVPNPEYPASNCASYARVSLGLLAHSAPLGIVFYTASQFPAQYQGDAFVAFHGSWNSSVPHGDKVVAVTFSGGVATGYQDFVTGWLSGGSYLDRPVGLAVGPDGSLYISSDQNGWIYKVTYGQ